MALLVLGLSHHTAPVTLRERFAFAEARVPATLQLLRNSGLAEEAVILSTCNRVELYVATPLEPRRAFAELQEFLLTCHDYRDPLTDEIYHLSEPQSIEHLFKVASGLDSMVLGETEILGQLKKAYDVALQHHHTGGQLNKAFQRAFNVAKQLRTETNIQRGSVSVASVAVELAEKIFTSLAGRQVIVIGAGETSAKAARALLSRGASSIIVSNRSYDRAEALAKELNGRAVHFDQWAVEFRQIDIVVSSTSAPHYVLDRAKLEAAMRQRGNEPLLLIDLAVPRDIDPEVNFLDNVYLYNVDDLQAIADDYLKQRKEELAKCEGIIREKAQALLGARRPTRPGLGAAPGLQSQMGSENCLPLDHPLTPALSPSEEERVAEERVGTAIELSDKRNLGSTPSPREERAGRGPGRRESNQSRPPLPGPLLLRSSGGEGEVPPSFAISFLNSTAEGRVKGCSTGALREMLQRILSRRPAASTR